ncbi:hypothetical protein BJ969_000922 [Saccharopolyspora gloriosae]|uniref:Uncharacterized protein n=1 Tax=Saccharopolyspora gloriosae TaxID=455344 RepID=A0A840N877_9PSEU|nr:hypothetical protein [Saccharopolyspora gloriosae]
MACCVALALVVAHVRELWFRLRPSAAPPPTPFAPPARRPMPRLQTGGSR